MAAAFSCYVSKLLLRMMPDGGRYERRAASGATGQSEVGVTPLSPSYASALQVQAPRAPPLQAPWPTCSSTGLLSDIECGGGDT